MPLYDNGGTKGKVNVMFGASDQFPSIRLKFYGILDSLFFLDLALHCSTLLARINADWPFYFEEKSLQITLQTKTTS